MDADRRIAALDEMPEDSTLLVTLRPVDPDSVDESEGDVGKNGDVDVDGVETNGGSFEAEAILLRTDGDVSAFRNYCQHWTDVRLDKDEGAFVRNGEVFCQKHGATFEGGTGYCNFGPCEGAILEDVDVTVDDGAVYLADDAYEFVRRGPSHRDDDAGDSRIDFTGN
ncbi:Rieske (2Fe-2S) protein [Halorubrum cibi]|uniref:Ferredoxin subunit of nitrite reductase or a ring-hydroxylating dioxygenase n=1 Tax=Halorubrum cibi TaxID=413815 RepID=A0A521DVZ8_9EURY|nr:Rieske 2Fe-2S domain-containing protein [Halorubrum cibi]SMO75877.1 Ferredoxin subunit of nitrite reductase or a ring-hydroxylating dioxygenase [Halorubrum cibi]